jgi:hypothetical protein
MTEMMGVGIPWDRVPVDAQQAEWDRTVRELRWQLPDDPIPFVPTDLRRAS